ncbi:hypothetical protein [Clostridioides sp. ES-S-0108-01]
MSTKYRNMQSVSLYLTYYGSYTYVLMHNLPVAIFMYMKQYK